jgi:hypothetical protein
MAEDPHSSNRSRRQRDLSNIPGFNHSRRTWTSNGMRVTMETATYASSGLLSRNAGDRSNSFSSFVQPSRSSGSRSGGTNGGVLGGGLLGGAINLLSNVANSQSRRNRPRAQPEKAEHVRQHEETESDLTSSDEDLAYGSLPRRPANSKSMLGRVKDRILEHGRPRTHEAAQVYEDAPPASTTQSRSGRRRNQPEPPDPPRTSRQRRSFLADFDETPESSPERRSRATHPMNDAHGIHAENEVVALQRAVENERKEYLLAKHRFQAESQRSVIDAEHVQVLLNQVKIHGALLATAQRRLQLAKEQQQRETRARPQRQKAQHPPSPVRESYHETDEDEEGFEPWPGHGFRIFTSASRSNIPFQEPLRYTGVSDPLFGFRVFDRIFSEADSIHGNGNGFHFFTGTGTTDPPFARPTFTSTGTSHHGASRSRSHYYAEPPQPAPQPPSDPLRVTEAARLCTKYNKTWDSLSASSPAIPYPTRTLLAPALSDPSTIPHQLAHTWSAEKIMQANTALFFILTLGLRPVISDSGTVTFDRAAAAESVIQSLIRVLKKEKMRWHSDRLGRRSENLIGGGVNEVLQRDERARAVFHGACELMKFAAGRAD